MYRERVVLLRRMAEAHLVCFFGQPFTDQHDGVNVMASVRIEPAIAERIAFATYQNAIPVLRDLEVFNDGSEPLIDLKLELTAEPAYFRAKTWHLDRLAAGTSLHLHDLDVALDGGRLRELNEAVRGEIIVSLHDATGLLAEARREIRFLAHDQWGGIGWMPELLTAFVQPNDPAVEPLLKAGSDVLRRAGKEPAMEGYQSRERRRVWEIVGAIWSAIGEMGLDYAMPPSSFEDEGQKVRSPSTIAESGRATCLDLVLLFCAAFEQAGLNPLIVMTEGHALAGVWLQPEELKSVTLDTPDALRKRIDLSEIIVFETTLVTQRPVPRLSWAIDTVKDLLSPEREAAFRMLIDVRRARMQRILPLPRIGDASAVIRTEEPEKLQQEEPAVEWEDAPELPDFDIPLPQEQEPDQSPTTRLDRWQRKLLDLTKRNRLLNFRASKRALWLVAPEPGRLEDLLAQGNRISLSPLPELTNDDDGRSDQNYRRMRHERIDQELAREALQRKEVMVPLPRKELDARLVELYRQAQSALQEGGANILFLAVGFLAWKPTARDRVKYKAPLILIPVSLERKSVRGGVKMVLHEDEPRFNPTLLEMLRQDFELTVPGVDPLPRDDHGIDVPGVWNRVRHAIVDQEGFEVTTDIVLATFSFAKYLMWKDLVERTEALKENPVVRHLLETPRETYRSDIDFPAVEKLDRELAPSETFAPLPADSSQLAAVAASSRGKDMILIGPPGTGKSQTIANLIAQNLTEGRSVLFVSEKTAALNVVYRRLEKLGLGEFCLELHSNKARKLDVLSQLRSAWEARGEVDEDTWRQKADRLKAIRDRLNLVVERLHWQYPNGLTPYEAMGCVIEGRGKPAPRLSWSSPEAHSKEQLQAMHDLVARLDVNAREIGDIANNPLRVVQKTDWSSSWQNDLLDAARDAVAQANNYSAARDALVDALSLDVPYKTVKGSEALTELAGALLSAHGRSLSFAFDAAYPKNSDRLYHAITLIEKYRGFAGQLSAAYDQSLFDAVDLDDLTDSWRQAADTWWPRSVILRHRVRKALRRCIADPANGSAPAPENDLGPLVEMRDIRLDLGACDDLAAYTDSLYCGLGTDTEALRSTLEVADRLRQATASLASDAESLATLRTRIRPLLSEANEMLDETANVGRACRRLLDVADALTHALERFEWQTGGSTADLITSEDADWLDEIVANLTGLEEKAPRLRSWCAWRSVRERAVEFELEPLVEMLELGEIAPGETPTAFELGYARWWSAAVIDADEILRTFVSAEHELSIEEFRSLDDQLAELTRQYIRAQLSCQLPAQSEVKRGSEFGILRRELEKKTRHKALRQLIKEMPTGLTQLTPCLLMSPLSIAQYLDPEQALFDVVVFDEASQITTWDAVGAIARGRQTIIVGDPRQLPPTSFFDRQDEDADEDVDVEGDLESILDECLGANMPTLHLRWHYRSKHESLIAFSNHRYYNGHLVTFPSNATEDRAVRLVKVDATYDKGGTRTNEQEAKLLVADITGKLADPTFVATGQSIGVVTFNAEQQRLIEDLLDEERRKNPDLEPFFMNEAAEPVMVKNLESVQGDERDVMYFSITYGPDTAGKISMNFGPMNRDGGERRLNVAITRARSQLRVFSSLTGDQIDLSRTGAGGVRDLKQFLEFAERGMRALGEASARSQDDFGSAFERAVAADLTKRGWDIYPKIGASSYRVDLGVVHPDRPGRYLAGVECDGPTYRGAATARDRDKLRESVLRSLGWEIIRAWSTEWWSDATGAADKLDKRLQTLLANERETHFAAAPEVGGPEAADFQATASEEPTETSEVTDVPTQPTSLEDAQEQGPPNTAPSNQAIQDQESKADEDVASNKTTEATDPGSLPSPEPERFYEESYTPRLLEIITRLIETCEPVRQGALATLVARHHRFDRTGRRIQERVEAIARQHFETTQEGEETFFWKTEPKEVMPFRDTLPHMGERDLEDIPLPELVGLAQEVRSTGDREAVLRAMADRLGLRRLTARARKKLEQAVEKICEGEES